MRLVCSHIMSIIGIIVVFALHVHPVSAETVAQGPFTDTECISCHSERDADLIRQWRDGPHTAASGVGCRSCHGDRHENANLTARKGQICTGCHEGPASHSYTTSKHGVINLINEGKLDWQEPLQRGKYRSPSCSYCHLHDRNHGDSMVLDTEPKAAQWICSGCHSPRYVREQFANAKRQLDIADLKLTEGEALINFAIDLPTNTRSKLRQSLIKHRNNILYGVGHQSPDYQWWYGQPALDGDLIRIRDAISELRRIKAPGEPGTQPVND